jgi:signal transduction histidine kinase
LLLAVALGVGVLLTTYVVPWTTTGVVDGLTTLLPVPVAFGAGLLTSRRLGGAACAWMALTIELNQGYVNPFVLVITIGPWVVGAILRDRLDLVRSLARVGEELEEESRLLEYEAVRLERARIARELHDIVAHCVSVMVVQAYAGERLAAADQQAATLAFDHISSAVARAKLEIAHLVDLLAVEPSPETDAPLLSKLQDLVEGAAAAGLVVHLHVAGAADRIPSDTAVVAYRVVQEGVTNALKHAPGVPIDVSLRCGAEIRIDVVNQLATLTDLGLGAAGGGHGLIGLRARVESAGGRFEAGPRETGAWRVSVGFPAVTP